MSLSLFGIILGLVLLMFLAYKGYSIIWVAPVCAVVVAVLSGYAILDAYIGDFMKGMADYVLQWFPAFFLGAVYGKVMDLTGSARSLGNALVKLIGPRFAVSAVVIPCLLTRNTAFAGSLRISPVHAFRKHHHFQQRMCPCP